MAWWATRRTLFSVLMASVGFDVVMQPESFSGVGVWSVYSLTDFEEPSSQPEHLPARHRRVMAPRSANGGAARKLSAWAEKSRPSTSESSLVPSSPMSERETMQDTEVTPSVGDRSRRLKPITILPRRMMS
ncbi:hypothetical protein M5K25_007460 [Dendrobium thyrsiflorum]|uniref:Secreted protein n=1 Tax=Dendrobium thyrsiflorum TaxID=117978 RepID=A0ABD0VE60_DENTH